MMSTNDTKIHTQDDLEAGIASALDAMANGESHREIAYLTVDVDKIEDALIERGLL